MTVGVLLIVEGDDAELAKTVLEHGAGDVGVTVATDPPALARRLDEGGFAVAVAAMGLGWDDGLAVLARVHARHPDCRTVLLLAETDLGRLEGRPMEGAVDAVLPRSSRGFVRLAPLVRLLAGGPGRGEPAAGAAEGAVPEAGSAAPRGGAAPVAETAEALRTALAHDLQDPLQIVMHSAGRLREAAGEGLPEAARRDVERIVTGAQRMQAMLDGLLHAAEAGLAPLEPAPVALDEVIDAAVVDHEETIATHGAEVVRAALPTVVCDRDGMVRVFRNLLGNALKFRGDAPPRIAIEAVERPGEWLISVTDNGIGIDAADAGRVFEMFARLDTAGAYPGTGVGLAVCRGIVRAHGGGIWVQPAPGGGSTFWLTLPRRGGSAPTATGAGGGA